MGGTGKAYTLACKTPIWFRPRKVDVRLPGKGNSNSHGARPVHQIITMIKWFRTSRLSTNNSLAPGPGLGFRVKDLHKFTCLGDGVLLNMCSVYTRKHHCAGKWRPQVDSTVTYVNRGSTFALRRSTLDVCLGGQRSLVKRRNLSAFYCL